MAGWRAPGWARVKRSFLGDAARPGGWWRGGARTREPGCGGARVGPAAGPARGERPPPAPLAGMEEPGMDTEAETVAAEAPARPLNCVEAEAAAGAAAEDACAARGSPQPAPAQPPGDPAAQASVSNGEDAGGGAAARELVDLKIIWNKTKHDVKFPLDSTGSELKQKIHSITGNPARGTERTPSGHRADRSPSSRAHSGPRSGFRDAHYPDGQNEAWPCRALSGRLSWDCSPARSPRSKPLISAARAPNENHLRHLQASDSRLLRLRL